MIHRCNVQCHAIDTKSAQLMGIEDEGKWMPFIFHMSIVDAAKQSSDDEDAFAYNCTTILTTHGETYIIDTNYEEFFEKFVEYALSSPENNPDNQDFNL